MQPYKEKEPRRVRQLLMRGVRIAALKEKPAAMRSRPVQSRAYASSQALQEAFVRVLMEEGFEKTTVREVTAGAGGGIGTFFHYFEDMCRLSTLFVHPPSQSFTSSPTFLVHSPHPLHLLTLSPPL